MAVDGSEYEAGQEPGDAGQISADPAAVALRAAGAQGKGALIEQLRDVFASGGWKRTLLMLAAVAAAPLVSAIAVLIAVSNQAGLQAGTPLPAGEWFPALWSSLAGGGVTIHASGTAGSLSASAGATASLLPLGSAFLAAALVGVVVSAGRLGARSGVLGVLVRCALDGVLVAGAATIAAAFTGIGTSGNLLGIASGQVSVGPDLAGVFWWTLAIVAIPSLVVRLGRSGALRRAEWAREAAWYAAVPTAVLCAASIAGFAALAAQNGNSALLLLWIPFGGNVAGLALGAAQFGGLHVSAGMIDQTLHLWDFLGPWSALVIVGVLVTLAWLAVFLGARRPRRRGFSAGRAWKLPVCVFIGSVLASWLLLPATVTAGFSQLGAGAGVSPSWETPFLAAAFAAVVSAAAEAAPRFVYTLSPALLARLAGRRATATWLSGSAASSASPTTEAAPPTTEAASPTTEAAPAPPALPEPSEHAARPLPQKGGEPRDLLPPRKPMGARAKERLTAVLVTAGIVAVVVVGGLVTVAVLNGARDPANQVRSYLDDIAAGHPDAASRLLDPGIRNEQRVLLSNRAFDHASQTITVTRVTTVSRTADSATVDAAFSLDGEAFSHTFHLVPGPKQWLFLDTWTLSGSPLISPVSFRGDASSATVGGVLVSLAEGSSEGSQTETGQAGQLYAYPGIYSVKVAGTGEYFRQAGNGALRVVPDQGGTADVSVQPTAALKNAVLQQVAVQAKACVTVPTNMGQNCPWAVQRTDLSAMTLGSAPDGFTDFDSGRFTTTEGNLTTTANGTTWNPSPQPYQSSFSFSGKYRVSGGKVSVSFTGVGF